MNILFRWVWVCLLLMVMVQPVGAKDRSKVAVFPFLIHSAEDLNYVRQGMGDMLASRISVSGKIEVISRDLVNAALQEQSTAELKLQDTYELGKKLGADFVVWGSITKIGNSMSIDGELIDVAIRKTTVHVSALCPTIDDVIPKINDFAQRIDSHIVGETLQDVASEPIKKDTVLVKPSSLQAAREAEIISGMRSGRKGTYTSSINPDFINAEQPLDRKTFWKSQQFAYEFRGMDIGDVNGDGLNETVIIDANSIIICQKRGQEFKILERIAGRAYDNYISVDVADINMNGIKEILVTNFKNQQVNSFVVEFVNGRYVTISHALPFFMRVVDNAAGVPLLLGQRRGMEKPFETPIYEITWQDGNYTESRKLRIPQGLSVYGLALDRLGARGEDKIIALDDYDYICVFEQTDKPLSRVAVVGGSDEFIWKSEGVFGGSNTVIENVKGSSLDSDENYHSINLRIVPYDTNKDGKREIIIVKNISSTNRILQRIKLFTSAEVYNLEWDGMGIVENWRTKKINGYVADYQFKDIDNDGENEVVLSLVLSVGGAIRDRSVIVAYKLNG